MPDREDMQGQDLFVHCTKIAKGDFLVPNTRVTFAMDWNERSQKWQAVDVRQLLFVSEAATQPTPGDHTSGRPWLSTKH